MFWPRPRVDSALVRIVPREDVLAPLVLESFDRIVEAAFAARRKRLAANLRRALGDRDWEARLVALGHGVSVRAEELSPGDYATLARSS